MLTRRQLLHGVAATAALPSVVTQPVIAQNPPARPVADEPAILGTPTLAPRQRQLLDFGWRFHLGHASDPNRDFGFGLYQRTYAKAGQHTADAALLEFDDSRWAPVDLPHDWAVSLPFRHHDHLGVGSTATEDLAAAHGYKPLGRDYPDSSIGWYRRVLMVPASDEGRRITLEFDGVFRNCLIFVNGYIVSTNDSGYAPFEVDISDFLDYGGRNLIAVRVDASLGEGWFYEGAGIYRHVWLRKTGLLYVPQWGVGVRTTVSEDDAMLSVVTEVRNDSLTAQTCSVSSTVLDTDGRTVVNESTAPLTIEARQTQRFEQALTMRQPSLWSPDTPYLYRLDTDVRIGTSTADRTETRFGIRTVQFDAERGFVLNGTPVKLKGTCNHQDHAGVGTALPDGLHRWRIEQLKAMGSNAYRTAHNPPATELLDACDALGLLVIDETRRMSTDPESLSELERMVRRDRNHPCVILWSLGNEEPQQGTARGARIAARMKRRVLELDPTRGCVIAMDKEFGNGVTSVIDVVGFNYRTSEIEPFHQRFPNKAIVGTETGSTVSTRGIYRSDPTRGYVRAYDSEYPWWASTAESWWSYFDERPYISGGFVWTGFDYRGEPTPYPHWPNVGSQFGLMDSCGFPKDNYYYYRVWWRSEPQLHLLPHWNWPKIGEPVDVWCYCNLDRVELLCNGRSVGSREIARNGHAEWKVPFEPGFIEARGYRGDQLVLTERRETTGEPAALRLLADRSQLRADGEDIAMIAVEVIDAKGLVVPTAGPLLTFQFDGPIHLLGTGNGDPSSREPEQVPTRLAFNGRCQLIVQTRRGLEGAIVVSASGTKLQTSKLELSAVKAPLRATDTGS